MPAIRDGRGQLHVHDMGAPPVNPPGPVERTRVSEQRMADFAAELAAAPVRVSRAERAFNPTQDERARATRNGQTALQKRRQEDAMAKADEERAGKVMAALERVGSAPDAYTRVGRELGLRANVVALIAKRARERDGELPRPVPARVVTRADVEAMVEPQGGEEGAPATAAVAAEQPDRDGSAVGSTPPSPPPSAGGGPGLVVMPCDGCAHAVVCSIRANVALKGWPHTWWSSPDVALSVTRVEVDCEHFLAVPA